MTKIYKITNLINGKCYIGKTSFSLEERMKSHICDSKYTSTKRNRPLYKAFNKYGIQNFTIDLIEEVEDCVASERESFWILENHSFHTGYNATLGGEGSPTIDKQKVEELLKEGKSSTDIAKILNCSSDQVRNILNSLGYNLRVEQAKRQSVAVSVYTVKGEFVKEFQSYTEGAKWLIDNNYTTTTNPQMLIPNIGRAAKGIRKTAFGFIWK